MAYLGKTPSQATRQRYYFTASGSETSVSGADDNSNTLVFTDGNYIDVILNGSTLVAGTDYNTNTANTVSGLAALSASDIIEIVVYDTFSVFGGNVNGDFNFGDNNKAIFGAGSDLQISHDGSNSRIAEAGTGDLKIGTSGGAVRITANGVTDDMIVANQGGSVTLSHSGSTKLATKSTGIDITGGFDATAGSTITTADNTTQLTLISTDADASEGPRLDLQRDSASPADGDVIGTVRYLGENSAGANLVFAEIQATLSDVTEGTIDSSLDLYVRRNNSLTSGFSLTQTQAIFNEGGNDIDFRVESDDQSNALFLNGNTSNFGINRSPTYELDVGANDTDGSVSGRIIAGTDSGASAIFRIHAQATAGARTSSLYFGDSANGGIGRIEYYHDGDSMRFNTNGSERMRLLAGGDVAIGKTSNAFGTQGFFFDVSPGQLSITCNQNSPLRLNRVNNDGTVVSIQGDGSEEGTISISGGTVSYNGGHLSRWSHLPDGEKDDTILKGTVLTNLDDMCHWVDSDGNVKAKEQLNQVQISSVEGDKNVAGVMVNWCDGDEAQYPNTIDLNMAMTGDMIIRIAQGTTVARGDLLMSAGDGTAKPQGDDIVRSKTIAKVTSTHISHTYDDGSYLVPCVLMAC